MDIFRCIQEIKIHLQLSFDKVDRWFDKDKKTLAYQPSNGGRTVQQILEHIYLTNFYLLILIEKGSKKALRNNLHLDFYAEIENTALLKKSLKK